MDIDKLVIYRNFKHEGLLRKICSLFDKTDEESTYTAAYELIELAGSYGLTGNLWHAFLALCLAESENSYSRACEIVGKIEGTLNEISLHDFEIFRKLYSCDIAELGDVWESLKNYKAPTVKSKIYNARVRDRIVELSVGLDKCNDANSFKDTVTEFYKEFGVGRFGLNKAFRIEEISDGRAHIEPITRIEHISLEELVGYELQKNKLIENTEAFVEGRPSNNVLLFGDAGTGKSSCVKAIVNRYYDKGLRIIEVYKHQFKLLSDVLEQIKDRNYKFIIYMDDLSFEDSELEYKYLKAILEGGLGKKPDNVLIYATSNRRHLIRESFRDKEETDEELHTRDTVQEKLSLSARFGVTIYFGSPDKNEYLHIVRELAKRQGLDVKDDELTLEAGKWELSHGGLSGRTASQFITYLKGKKRM